MLGSRWVVGNQTQVAGAQIGWAIEEKKYVNQCLRAEGWTTEEPVSSTRAKSQHIQRLQDEARKEREHLTSRRISEGACSQLGFSYYPGRWVVIGVSPNAREAGIQIGDRVVSVSGRPFSDLPQPTLDEEYSRWKIGDRLNVVVQRGNVSEGLEVPCQDGWPVHSTIVEAVDAILSSRWDDCLELTNRIETLTQLEPWPSQTARMRLNCALAKMDAEGRNTGWGEAQLAYEWRRRLVRDAHVADAIGDVRADVLTGIQGFRQQGFTAFADDLESSLEGGGGKERGTRSQGPPPGGGTKGGTCFAIGSLGQVATAYHVIANASSILVRFDEDPPLSASVASVSRVNDLAVLSVDRRTNNFLPLAPPHSARIGERVFTIGYPLVNLLGEEPKFTDGAISAVTGPGGEGGVMQISVPVQPGNSGGPLVDERGRAVGVVTSTAAIADFLEKTGTLPQNVSWAVSTDLLGAIVKLDNSLPPTSREGAIERAKGAICQVEAQGG